MIKIPKIIKPLINIIEKNGGKCILVGGFIRDSLLKIKSKDIDLEIYNFDSFNKLYEILKDYGNATLVGKNFGVLKINIDGYDIDISLARIEYKVSTGHKGFNILFINNFDFKKAAKRRDFTINAIGYDIKTKTILDPYNGIEDLKNRVLKYVDEQTFIQDPLRVFRAIGFCARFLLTCQDNLIKKCRFLADNNFIDELPKQRIYQEILKLLLLSKKPSIGFKLFHTFNLIKYFPELLHVKNNFLYLDNMVKLKTKDTKTNIILMFGILAFDFSSQQEVDLFLDRFLDNKFIKREVQNLFLQKDSLKQLSLKIVTNYDIYLLSTKVNIKNLLIINEARELKYKNIKNQAIKLNILIKKPKPLLCGIDLINLGLLPSPKFSIILKKSYDAQLKELFLTKDDAKKWLKNNF